MPYKNTKVPALRTAESLERIEEQNKEIIKLLADIAERIVLKEKVIPKQTVSTKRTDKKKKKKKP